MSGLVEGVRLRLRPVFLGFTLLVTLFGLETLFAESDAPALPETLLAHVYRQVESRRPKGDFEPALTRQFIDWDTFEKAPTRNPSHWLKGVSLSFISVCGRGTKGEWLRNGTAILITPRHVSMASHHRYGPGDQLLWISDGGRHVVRTISQCVEVPGSDITVGLLSEQIDEREIRSVAIIGKEDFLACLARDKASPDLTLWVPVLASNRDRSLTLQVLRGVGPRLVLSSPKEASPDLAPWQPFYVPPQSGTSGSPFFWLIDGRVALLGHYSTAHPDTGPFYGWFSTAMQEAIDKTNAPLPLHFVDLSRFKPARPPAEFPPSEKEATGAAARTP